MRYICPNCHSPQTGEFGATMQCTECQTENTVPETVTSPGAIIGDFEIIRELGKGGIGLVFLARQISLDRKVALKLLQGKHTENEDFVKGFINEARVAAKISHPNIVQVYTVGEENKLYYFAMEFIDGSTMKQELAQKGKIPFVQAAKIIAEVASALDYAWEESKIVHQDIKPDNIMITKRGVAKLADLGLARQANLDHGVDEDDDEVLGTPQYISPEQLIGEPTDTRSDIYSLGATFFHFVTGRFPYIGKNSSEITHQHVAGNLTPPKEFNPELPAELNRIICKMMARRLDSRYQTAELLFNDLTRFISNQSTISVPVLKSAHDNKPKITVPNSPKATSTPKATPAQEPVKLIDLAEEPPPIIPVVKAEEKVEEKIAEPIAIKPQKRKISKGLVLGICGGIVGLVIVLLGVTYGVLRMGILPEELHKDILTMAQLEPTEESFIGFKFIASAESETPEETAKETPKEASKEPPKVVVVKKPKPVTRPEYIAGVESILEALRNKMSDEQFLDLADKFFGTYPEGPQTAEERRSVSRILESYGRIDEKIRFVPMRKILQAAERDVLNKKRENEKLAQKERDKQLAIQREQQRKINEQNEAIKRETIRLQQLEQKHFNEVHQALNTIKKRFYVEFLTLMQTDDMDKWKIAHVQMINETNRVIANTVREQEIKNQTMSFANNLNQIYIKNRKLYRQLLSPENLSQISFELAGNRLLTAEKVENGILYSKENGKTVRIALYKHTAIRTDIVNRMIKKFKLNSKEVKFYLPLFTGNYMYIDANQAPNAILKKEINNMIKEYLIAQWAKADEKAKKLLKYRYGKMKVFKQVKK